MSDDNEEKMYREMEMFLKTHDVSDVRYMDVFLSLLFFNGAAISLKCSDIELDLTAEECDIIIKTMRDNQIGDIAKFPGLRG